MLGVWQQQYSVKEHTSPLLFFISVWINFKTMDKKRENIITLSFQVIERSFDTPSWNRFFRLFLTYKSTVLKLEVVMSSGHNEIPLNLLNVSVCFCFCTPVQKPEKLSSVCVAAALRDGLSAYTALHTHARMAAGHTLLVMDGASVRKTNELDVVVT